jgi:hypothetical protein
MVVFRAVGVLPYDVYSTTTKMEVLVKRHVTSIRIDPDTLRQLKRLAHRKSLESDREVSWATMVRQAIEVLLTEKQEQYNLFCPTLAASSGRLRSSSLLPVE